MAAAQGHDDGGNDGDVQDDGRERVEKGPCQEHLHGKGGLHEGGIKDKGYRAPYEPAEKHGAAVHDEAGNGHGAGFIDGEYYRRC